MIPEAIFIAVVAIAIISVFIRQSASKTLGVLPKRALHFGVIGFVFYFFLLSPLIAFIKGVRPDEIFYIYVQLAAFGYFGLLAFERADLRLLNRCLKAIAISAIILSIVVIYLSLTGQTFGDTGRVTGIEGDRSLTLPLLPVGVSLTALFAIGSSTPVERYSWIAGTGICLAAVTAGVTRGSLLAVLATACVCVFALRPKVVFNARTFVRVLYLGLLAIPMLLPFVDVWLERFFGGGDGDAGTIGGRLDEYASFFEGFLDSPILGQGIGYRFIYPSEFDVALSTNGILVCHNHVMFFLGTTGILGVLAYYCLVGGAIWRLYRSATDLAFSFETRLAATRFLATGVCGFIFTLSSTTFTTVTYNIALATVVYASTLNWNARAYATSSPNA